MVLFTFVSFDLCADLVTMDDILDGRSIFSWAAQVNGSPDRYHWRHRRRPPSLLAAPRFSPHYRAHSLAFHDCPALVEVIPNHGLHSFVISLSRKASDEFTFTLSPLFYRCPIFGNDNHEQSTDRVSCSSRCTIPTSRKRDQTADRPRH